MRQPNVNVICSVMKSTRCYTKFNNTVLFRPTVHEFGNFGLREGRKFYFRFMANFKSGLFFRL